MTWTLASPISLDRVTAALPTSGPNAVRSVAGAAVGGANASFAFNVVLGDVSGDRKVLSNDMIAIRAMIAAGGYSLFFDLNGDGIVDSRDQAILTGRLGTSV